MSWDQIVQEAKNEREVTFLGFYGENFFKEAAARFKDKYGIDVRVVIGDQAANNDKVLAEKDRTIGTIDTLMVGGIQVKTTMDADVWYGPIFQKLPAFNQLDQQLGSYQEGVETKGYLVPLWRNQTMFLYDPERVANPPQTWDEFTAWVNANPKGFAYSDPNKGGTGSAFVQTVISNLTGGIDKYKGDTEVDPAKVANWTLAWDWLRANNPKMNVTLSNSESTDLLNQGAASLVVAWEDEAIAALSTGTLFKRAKSYIPSMGLPGGGDTAGVLKNAPHKAAALLFLDFLTTAEIQELMNQILGATPARTDITNYSTLVPEDQRQKNATTWLPAAYKADYAKGYTQHVLLQ